MPREAQELQSRLPGYSHLLAICQEVHSSTCGTGSLFEEDRQKHLEVLRVAVRFWRHPERPHPWDAFDAAVLALIKETLREAGETLEEAWPEVRLGAEVAGC